MLNILLSYAYWDDRLLEQLFSSGVDARLLIDCGAFTVKTQGKVIELNDYCDFLKRIGKRDNIKAFQLDVIGEPKKTLENYEFMLKEGLETIPIFTRGTEFEVAEYLYSTTDYIALGGTALGKNSKNYVKWFLTKNRGRKVHLLGFADLNFLKFYRPYSVDSSSWCISVRYGTISLYSPDLKIVNFKKENIKDVLKYLINNSLLFDLTYEQIELLGTKEAWNLWPEDLNFTKARGAAIALSTLSYVKRAIDLEEKLNVRDYLVINNSTHLTTIIEAYKRIKGIK